MIMRFAARSQSSLGALRHPRKSYQTNGHSAARRLDFEDFDIWLGGGQGGALSLDLSFHVSDLLSDSFSILLCGGSFGTLLNALTHPPGRRCRFADRRRAQSLTAEKSSNKCGAHGNHGLHARL